VSFMKSRLRRVEVATRKGPGGRCSECGLTLSEHGRPVALYEEHPDKGFDGDPDERCPRCGRNLYTVLRVVYEGGGDYR
jgi:ribosomal protein L37E